MMSDLFHDIDFAARRGQRGPMNLRKCDQAIGIWQQLLPVLRNCETQERESFDHISATFTGEAVRLRTMLE